MPEITGDIIPVDAGQGQADLEATESEQTGDTIPADAGQGGSEQTEGVEDSDAPGDEELAFKKRLEREIRKLREEIRAELEAEYQRRYVQPPSPESQQEIVESLADRLGITTEAARAILNQQILINQLREREAMNEARAEVEALRATRKELPPWDEKKLSAIRERFEREYGYPLPWKDAYRLYVAEEALSGEIRQRTEQDVLANVQRRDKSTVKTGKGGDTPTKRSAWDLSPDEFAALRDRALRGELKAQ